MSISVDSIATSRAFPAETRDVASAAYCPVEREQIILIVLAIFLYYEASIGRCHPGKPQVPDVMFFSCIIICKKYIPSSF